MIVIGYRPPVNASLANAGTGASGATASSLETGTSVDQVMAANVAATLAESADLAVTNNVANLSQSLSIESTLAQTDTNVISKPQILQPAADSRVTVSYTHLDVYKRQHLWRNVLRGSPCNTRSYLADNI